MFLMMSFARSSILIRQLLAIQAPANCQGNAGLPSRSLKQRCFIKNIKRENKIQGYAEHTTQQLLTVPRNMHANSMLITKYGFVGS